MHQGRRYGSTTMPSMSNRASPRVGVGGGCQGAIGADAALVTDPNDREGRSVRFTGPPGRRRSRASRCIATAAATGRFSSYAAPEPVLAQADTMFSGGCVGRACEF